MKKLFKQQKIKKEGALLYVGTQVQHLRKKLNRLTVKPLNHSVTTTTNLNSQNYAFNALAW